METINIKEYTLDKIYIQNGDKAKTLQELFLIFYCNGNLLLEGRSAISYNESSCRSYQCHANKFRSLQDLLSIANTYFPDATFKEIIYTLITLPLKDSLSNNYYIRIRSCPDVSGINLFYKKYLTPDQLRFKWEVFKSKYNWKEIFTNLFGIDNPEDLRKFIEKNYDKNWEDFRGGK